jgi:cell division protein FtsN
MPNMPASGSGFYCLQVGSYANGASAREMYDKLVRNGFAPVYENYQNYTRVVLPSINAADIPEIARRLGSIGVQEIWVRR